MTDRRHSLPLASSDVTVRAALAALDRGGLQILLIADGEGRLKGVVTDGDVRRGLLRGVGLDDPIGRIMNAKFVSVLPEVSRVEVLDMMKALGRQQIPVLDRAGHIEGLHILRELVGAANRPNWAVIMAGGRGERLRPLTDDIPKPMLRVAGRPILERLILHLVGFGIKKILIAVNYKGEQIETHFGDGQMYGCEIAYIREDRPLGTAGGLALLSGVPKLPLIIMNGDLVTTIDAGALLDAHSRRGWAITVAAHPHAYRVPFGVIEETPEGSVIALREKPTQVWTVNAGIYVVDPRVLEWIPKGTPYTMPELADECLRRGERVGTFRIENDWIDVGRRDELMKARGEG